MQRVHRAVAERLGGTAVHAGEMVLVAFHRCKQGFAAGKVPAADQASLLQLAQMAVHGGQAHALGPLPQQGVKLLARELPFGGAQLLQQLQLAIARSGNLGGHDPGRDGSSPDPMETLWWLLPLLLALVVGALCPLAGTLLLVQRRLFLANLVSHAVLPGLALAMALRLDPALGGLFSGVAGALLAERLSAQDRPGQGGDEAVINTVLAGFLGLGVLLIPLLGIRVNLEAVLFGDLLAAAPLDLLRSLVTLGAIVLLLALRYRHYVYVGVDPLGAASAGLPVRQLRLLLTAVTALTVVSAMSAVGVVLVIALMGAPALVAMAGAVSLRQALLRASLLGMAISGLGFVLALQPAVNLPPGPLIGVLCLGLLPLRAWLERRSAGR
jgi:zinc/manganese transport system permease protein